MADLPAAVEREAWPSGAVRERTVDQVAFCRVRTFDTDTELDIRAADKLELANRRALRAWLGAGREI